LKALLKGKPVSLPVFAARVSPGSMIVTEEGNGRASIPIAPVPVDTDVSDAGTCDAGNVSQQVMYGAVVASWGLHAALVADSDTTAYRKFGSERFKMAAQELLYPSDGSESHRFRGQITITTRTDSSESTDGIQLQQRVLSDQEHMYVLATLVPRLEKEFLISPDSEALGGKMQFLRFGPMGPEDAMRLMTLAYQGGQHVREESVMYEEVERVRIDFHEDEERWRRLCIDGKIVAVEEDGWMELCMEERELLNVIKCD
jgi:diacylglycerol kinase family enzyme